MTHPVFRRPGFGRHHPLSNRRQGAVLEICEALGWLPAERVEIAPLADRATLERLHAGHYLDALEQAAAAMQASPEVRARYNIGTMECPLFEGLMERARASVGGAILAAEIALGGAVAFHPGGGTHHGKPDRASGFCFLNDPAFAIRRFLDAGLERVLYVDLDAHHGDGVEAIHGADPRVALVSIHEAGRWPGTGPTGIAGAGRICNVAVARAVTDAEYAAIQERIVRPFAERWRPQALVVVLGADGLAGDPLSSMALTNGALWRATEALVGAVPRAAVLGGGGYNPWTTARLWAGQWGRLAGYPIPDALPAAARAVLAGLDSDLVEAEDRDPAWLATLADAPGADGGVRAEVVAMIDGLGAAVAALPRTP